MTVFDVDVFPLRRPSWNQNRSVTQIRGGVRSNPEGPGVERSFGFTPKRLFPVKRYGQTLEQSQDNPIFFEPVNNVESTLEWRYEQSSPYQKIGTLVRRDDDPLGIERSHPTLNFDKEVGNDQKLQHKAVWQPAIEVVDNNRFLVVITVPPDTVGFDVCIRIAYVPEGRLAFLGGPYRTRTCVLKSRCFCVAIRYIPMSLG